MAEQFYIGRGVFASIEGQIVYLRKQDGSGGITFDTGGITILMGHYVDQTKRPITFRPAAISAGQTQDQRHE